MEELSYSDEDLNRAVDKWRGQNRKGFLELCILRCVRSQQRIYGFAIMDYLLARGLDLGEGSLYPLLARMVKEKLMVATWDTPTEGHPRKYYTLSLFGLDYLQQIEKFYLLDHEIFMKLDGGGAQ